VTALPKVSASALLDVLTQQADGRTARRWARRGEYGMPVPGHENQVSVQDEDTVPGSAHFPVSSH
jgi:hypothetical protein